MSVVFEDRANGLAMLDDKTRDFIASVDLSNQKIVVATQDGNVETIDFYPTIDDIEYIFSKNMLSPAQEVTLSGLIDLAEFMDDVKDAFAYNWQK